MSAASTTRCEFLALPAALGVTSAWAARRGRPPLAVQERRDVYPEGVDSGDPDADSVLLRTRHPYSNRPRAILRVEVSQDEDFHRVVAVTSTHVEAVSDLIIVPGAGHNDIASRPSQSAAKSAAIIAWFGRHRDR